MLPTISIDLNRVFTKPSHKTGETYAIDWGKLVDTCRQTKLSVERYLTIRICSYILSRHYKVPILVTFAPSSSMVLLSICCKYSVDFTGCLHITAGMPGYLEYGSDLIANNALPLLYYDGDRFYRTYTFHESQSDEHQYATDIGNGLMMNTFQTDEEFYNELVRNPEENIGYSIVPKESIEMIVIPQSRFELRHVVLKNKII